MHCVGDRFVISRRIRLRDVFRYQYQRSVLEIERRSDAQRVIRIESQRSLRAFKTPAITDRRASQDVGTVLTEETRPQLA